MKLTTHVDQSGRVCTRCFTYRAWDEFYVDRNAVTGFLSSCKPCQRVRSQKWLLKHRDRRKKALRSIRLKREFGITTDEYDAQLHNQGGVCAICQNPCPTGNRLAVDHDHTTGNSRGLLCLSCNTKLGWYENRASVIHDYLANPPMSRRPR